MKEWHPANRRPRSIPNREGRERRNVTSFACLGGVIGERLMCRSVGTPPTSTRRVIVGGQDPLFRRSTASLVEAFPEPKPMFSPNLGTIHCGKSPTCLAKPSIGFSALIPSDRTRLRTGRQVGILGAYPIVHSLHWAQEEAERCCCPVSRPLPHCRRFRAQPRRPRRSHRFM